MTNNIEFLDPICLPLCGERLIEASAGTGKTFIITILYLRLLLGLGGKATSSRPLSVEDLLVMTFTEAATTELRNRIRTNIHDFRIACLCQNTNNSLFKRLLDEIADKQQAAQLLLLAEQQIDKAAIFTIHGFCQRMLNSNFFKFGALYKQQFIEDEFELRYQACVKFWRQYYYPLPRNIAEVVYKQWKNPEALLRAIDQYLQGEAPIIKLLSLADKTLISRHKSIISRIVKLKKKWCESVSDIDTVIENSSIDRRRFNRNNQAKWIEKINSWAQEETYNYQLPDALKRFSQHFLAKRTKLNGIIPEHSLFVAIDDLLAEPLTLKDLIYFHAITEIREIINNEKHHRGELSFDDIINNFEKALISDTGKILAQAIRERFPVAIIDEFQDIDPQQYRIFRHIWHCQPKIALLLVGDPKQAIYSFRGADIFAYIKARSEMKACYTLDTNWRSAHSMVTSVNTLFTRIHKAFIFHEIPFLKVKSAKENATLRFEWQGKIQPAMRFWLMDGDGCNIKDYQNFMAQQSAAQIRNWLIAGEQGEALLWRGEISKPVTASDITILVRNRREAMLMHTTLTSFGIPSRYSSNYDSVFNTIEAKEMLWLLQAVLLPKRKSVLRNALASSIFGLTAFDIDFLNNDETSWKILIEEFIEYREYWQKQGVMAMLRKLMTRRRIIENILATPGSKRRLTNLLHISKLLQEASLQVESQSALIRWLAQHVAKPNSNLANQRMRLENDKHLVKIVTIHKAKGLEYPLVWLPFIADYRIPDQAFYHDRASFKPILDLSQVKESMEFAKVEKLAEDLRLLYVALTRSIWHCSLGVAPLFRRCGKKNGKTDFHHSAIGYLIQKGEPKEAVGLRLDLKSLCNEYITLHIPDMSDNSCFEFKEPTSQALEVQKTNRKITSDWKVISYS